MKVISFDQSTSITGYAIWIDGKLEKYNKLIVENPDKKNPWFRMREMYDMITVLIDEENPDFVGFEGVQYQGGLGTYQVLSEMRGVLAAKLFEIDVGFEDIMPTEWKSFCGITANAKRKIQKDETRQMVKEEFGLEVSEDEADAIALGLFLQDILKREKRWKKGNMKRNGKSNKN